MTHREKAFRILDILKINGFEEYWPPSRTKWHFRKGTVRVDFHWPTATCSCWSTLTK